MVQRKTILITAESSMGQCCSKVLGPPSHQRYQRTSNTFIASSHTQPALWGQNVSSTLPTCPALLAFPPRSTGWCPQVSPAHPGRLTGWATCPGSPIPRQGPLTSSFLHNSLWGCVGNSPSLPSSVLLGPQRLGCWPSR